MNRRTLMKTVAAIGAVTALGACAMDDRMDIVDIAASNDDFSTLVTAVTAAELVDVLKGEGPFTVFAPTNAAFDALPDGTVASLLEPESKDALTGILTYHVVPGFYPASSLAGAKGNIPTAQGGTLAVDGTNGVTVNGVNVVTPDIMASNGVIHVIDGVLLP